MEGDQNIHIITGQGTRYAVNKQDVLERGGDLKTLFEDVPDTTEIPLPAWISEKVARLVVLNLSRDISCNVELMDDLMHTRTIFMFCSVLVFLGMNVTPFVPGAMMTFWFSVYPKRTWEYDDMHCWLEKKISSSAQFTLSSGKDAYLYDFMLYYIFKRMSTFDCIYAVLATPPQSCFQKFLLRYLKSLAQQAFKGVGEWVQDHDLVNAYIMLQLHDQTFTSLKKMKDVFPGISLGRCPKKEYTVQMGLFLALNQEASRDAYNFNFPARRAPPPKIEFFQTQACLTYAVNCYIRMLPCQDSSYLENIVRLHNKIHGRPKTFRDEIFNKQIDELVTKGDFTTLHRVLTPEEFKRRVAEMK